MEAARCMDVPVSPMMMYLNKYAYDIVLCLRPPCDVRCLEVTRVVGIGLFNQFPKLTLDPALLDSHGLHRSPLLVL